MPRGKSIWVWIPIAKEKVDLGFDTESERKVALGLDTDSKKNNAN